MFQNDRLLPWLTIGENVCFQSKIKGPRLKLEMLELVGLSDQKDKYPSQLSGGQKQRVALARALMAHPQLLLLDEPLGALDALTRRQMQDLILKICREQKLTTILVTHDVNEAVRMADRVIVIRDGTSRFEETGVESDDVAKVAIAAGRPPDIMGRRLFMAEQKMTRHRKPYLYEVDFMRCVFIFGVLLNHTTTAFGTAMNDSLVNH